MAVDCSTKGGAADDDDDGERWVLRGRREEVRRGRVAPRTGIERERLTRACGTEDEGESQRVTWYMTVILWSVAGLSAFKFIGATWFLIVRMFRGV